MRDFWKWCWCWALAKFITGRKKVLIVTWSDYIKWIPHMSVADDVKAEGLEETVPEGEKKKGWAGVKHALTSRWKVRRG